MNNKISIWLSSLALFFALISFGFTFLRCTPMQADWIGILVGILAMLTTLLIGWQIISYLGFKDETKKELEKGISKIEESVSKSDEKIHFSIEKSKEYLIHKNQSFIQGSIAYLESYPTVLNKTSLSENYNTVYKDLVSAFNSFCNYGAGAEDIIIKCLLLLETVLKDFDDTLKGASVVASAMDRINKNNFENLDFSKDNSFIKLKAEIINSSKSGISQNIIDKFIEIEQLRERIVLEYNIICKKKIN